jgi:hypothetical protein
MDWITSAEIAAIPVALLGLPAIILMIRGRSGFWLSAWLLVLTFVAVAVATVLGVFREDLGLPSWARGSAFVTGVALFAIYTLSRLVGDAREAADEAKRKRDVSAAASEALKRDKQD